MKTVLTFAFLFLVFACSGAPRRLVYNSELIKEFLNDTPYTHFTSACRLYDLNGSLAAFIDGNHCVFEPDGSFYRRSDDALDYTTADQKTVWRTPVENAHHQISHSAVSGNFLAISNDIKEWNGKKTRFDVLLLLNKKGQIIRQFSFYTFFKKHPEVLKYKAPSSIHELTHANSFIELTRKNADGKQTVVGYLTNCTYQSKFYILDSNLTNVVKVIDLNDISTHSVSQIADDVVLYYRNSNPETTFSSAETFNLTTNEFVTLYRSNNPYLGGIACGSVQVLGPTKLMLSHSQCVPSDNKADYGLAVEFVDLIKRQSFHYLLHKKVPYSNSSLIDGKKLVDSSPKL